MSKENNPKKKVVVTTRKDSGKTSSGQKRSGGNRPTRTTRTAKAAAPVEMVFNSTNYLWMGIGVVLIILGLLLMAGGGMEDPNQWDEDVIYSFRRTVIAPILILSGLVVEIYAIFKK